jgi:hypothetical protein
VTVCAGFFNYGHEMRTVARRKPEIITSNYFCGVVVVVVVVSFCTS